MGLVAGFLGLCGRTTEAGKPEARAPYALLFRFPTPFSALDWLATAYGTLHPRAGRGTLYGLEYVGGPLLMEPR